MLKNNAIKEQNMAIEEIIEMIKDFKRLAYTEDEAKKLEENFIKNFKNEYEIIEK